MFFGFGMDWREGAGACKKLISKFLYMLFKLGWPHWGRFVLPHQQHILAAHAQPHHNVGSVFLYEPVNHHKIPGNQLGPSWPSSYSISFPLKASKCWFFFFWPFLNSKLADICEDGGGDTNHESHDLSDPWFKQDNHVNITSTGQIRERVSISTES